MKPLIMSALALPCYLVITSKYLPQHPILEHTQPVLFPEYERPSFTPIKTPEKFIETFFYEVSLLFLKSRYAKILKIRNMGNNNTANLCVSICYCACLLCNWKHCCR